MPPPQKNPSTNNQKIIGIRNNYQSRNATWKVGHSEQSPALILSRPPVQWGVTSKTGGREDSQVSEQSSVFHSWEKEGGSLEVSGVQ